MPQLRKAVMIRRSRRDFSELTEGQRHILETGWWFFADDDFENADELRAAWEIHRESILGPFIAANPGRRPFAWWLCDHGHERPIINPFLTTEAIAQYREKAYGFLDTQIHGDGKYFQEPEEDYLQRLGLLTLEEIAAPDDKPHDP